jgi:hypothetical protein
MYTLQKSKLSETIAREDLRILIASTEKTGNTWLKLLLSHIYDLPTPHISEDFSPAEADTLGRHWVTHQHFLPQPRLLEWASARNAHIFTMLRHPGDLLVSLYHYCCNYAAHYKHDRRIAEAIAADADERRAMTTFPHHVIDGHLIRALQDRVMCDLNISISWMLSRRSSIVRYEDLRANPSTTLRDICARIAPASENRIQQAIEQCQLDVLRGTHQEDRRFFRKALVGEWRVLPQHIIRRFRDEEPFRSQFLFLGYEANFDQTQDEFFALKHRDRHPKCHDQCFDDTVPFAPVLQQLLGSCDPDKRQQWQPVSKASVSASFFQWLNAPAEEDASKQRAVPRVTNLAAFIYSIRPDLQTTFPDIFDADRLGYAAWFLRYAAYAYQLDHRFLTPIALSWISAD